MKDRVHLVLNVRGQGPYPVLTETQSHNGWKPWFPLFPVWVSRVGWVWLRRCWRRFGGDHFEVSLIDPRTANDR